LLEDQVHINDRLRIGSAEFIVTQPRLPCFKLGIRFGDMDMVRNFLKSKRSRFYLAVIREGRLLALTTPSQAKAAIAGHIFEGTVDIAEIPRLRAERTVTQSLLVEGRNRARVYEPAGAPPAGFSPATVTLEDAYLVLMRLGSLPGHEMPTTGARVAAVR